MTGIPAAQQHLVWHSSELKDEQSLQDSNVYSGATLQLVLSMQGGPVNMHRGMAVFLIVLNAVHIVSFHIIIVFILSCCATFLLENDIILSCYM